MFFPNMPYTAKKSQQQTKFGGINHHIAASNGEIWDMQNMTSDYYPVLGNRKPRWKFRILKTPNGMCAAGKLFWIDGTTLYVDGENKGTVSNSEKVFCPMGERVVIWPDKLVYTLDGKLESIESKWSGTNLTFRDGEYAGEKADANTIYKAGAKWENYFKVGDGVTIEGCTAETRNNLTLVIREISGDFMRFYENSFVIPFKDVYVITDYNTVDVEKTFYFTDRAGDTWNFYMNKTVTIGGYFVWNGIDLVYHNANTNVDYILDVTSGASGTQLVFDMSSNSVVTETETVTIKRTAPDLDFLCGYGNRIWGCKGDTIYASKMGDPYNWNVFDGISTDSYSVGTGTERNFTGCISYLNHPIFFKEDRIFKVYGSSASTFQVVESAVMGVPEGSSKSLAISGNTLFYLSRAGVVAYNGGVPVLISSPLGEEHFKNAVGGSDGVKYFVSMQDESEDFHLFVYDTQKRLWHKEDDIQIKQMVYLDGLYAVLTSGEIYLLGDPLRIPQAASEESNVLSMVEFGDFDLDTMDRKHFIRLRFRVEIEIGGYVKFYIKYDHENSWKNIGEVHSKQKNVYVLSCPLKRCDHFQLRLEGSGNWKLHAMEYQNYIGGNR